MLLISFAGAANDPGLNRQIWVLDWSFFAGSGLVCSWALHATEAWLTERHTGLGLLWRLLPAFAGTVGAMLILRRELVVLLEPAPFNRTEWFGIATIAEAGVALAIAGGVFFAVHLSGQLQRSRADHALIAAALKDAQLQALRAQINPHFLFNTLNTVRALISDDPARAREAVTVLSGILRAGLDADQQPTVPLDDELAIAGQYLQLQRLRFESRLQFSIAAPPEAALCRIPPFLLQELVENAIKHGIAQSEEGGQVRIEITADQSRLRARVSNSGTLRSLSRTEGKGLENIRRRLDLLFGAEASFEIVQHDPATVVAEVSLPLG